MGFLDRVYVDLAVVPIGDRATGSIVVRL